MKIPDYKDPVAHNLAVVLALHNSDQLRQMRDAIPLEALQKFDGIASTLYLVIGDILETRQDKGVYI